MSLSPLQKSFLSSACVSSVIFGVSTIPLATLSSLPIDVQVKNQSVFEGEMSALAGPYLGLAGTVSLAVGVSILGISGWRATALKAEADQGKQAELERNLLACKAELERIKFSDARLKMEKLDTFLQPNTAPIAKQPITHERSNLQDAASRRYEVISAQHGMFHSSSETGNSSPLHLATPYSEAKAYPQPHGMFPTVSSAENSGATQYYSNNGQGSVNSENSFALDSNGAPDSIAPMHETVKDSENQLETMLHQLHDLMTRVESLQSQGNNRMAA